MTVANRREAKDRVKARLCSQPWSCLEGDLEGAACEAKRKGESFTASERNLEASSDFQGDQETKSPIEQHECSALNDVKSRVLPENEIAGQCDKRWRKAGTLKSSERWSLKATDMRIDLY